MAKKPAGLGRSLGELLDDNTPQLRAGKGSASVNQGGETIHIGASKPSAGASAPSTVPKSLYETRHKNKSIKANFKNFK